MKRTLKRESKVLEIVEREAILSMVSDGWCMDLGLVAEFISVPPQPSCTPGQHRFLEG